MRFLAAWSIAGLLALPHAAAAQTPDTIDRLIAQAAEAADPKAAVGIAERAVQMADAERPASPDRRYRALQILSQAVTRHNMSAVQPIVERMAVIAEAAWGPRAHRTLWARFNAANFATLLGRPGGGIAKIQPLAEALAAGATEPQERIDAASALATIADYLSIHDSSDRAQPFAARAVALLETVPRMPSSDIGDVYFVVARVASVSDRPQEAIDHADRAIAAYTAFGGPEHESIPPTLGIAAYNAGRLGDYDRAETDLRRAVRIVDSRTTLPIDVRLRAPMDYGLFLAAIRRYQLAFPLIERALIIARDPAIAPSFRRDLTMAAARVYLAARRPTDALRLLTAVAGDDGEPPTRLRALVLMDMARAHLQAGDGTAAGALAVKASAIVGALSPPDAPLGGVLDALSGDIALARADHGKAQRDYESALKQQLAFGATPRTLAETRMKLAVSQTRAGRADADGWRSARVSADVIIADTVRIAASRRAPSSQGDANALYDHAIEVAWAAATRRQ